MFEVLIPCAVGVTFVVAVATVYVLRRRRQAVVATRGGVQTAVLAVEDGQKVKVVGRVKFVGTPAEAPLTKRRCVCWEVLYEHRGVVVSSESYSDVFLVTTQAGTVTVKASHPMISLIKERSFDLNSDDCLNVRLMAFCQSRSIEWDGAAITENITGASRYLLEGALVEGARVAVTGVALWGLDPTSASGGAGYRDVPRRLVIVHPSDGKIEISNEAEALFISSCGSPLS